jgi:hypothetical protein
MPVLRTHDTTFASQVCLASVPASYVFREEFRPVLVPGPSVPPPASSNDVGYRAVAYRYR